jgi:hypothetical protein
MIIIPREIPVLENLNSYYVDIPKLVEHCQGEFGSGCIHLQSPRIEGVIFFDNDELLNSIFKNKEGQTEGQAALDGLIEAAAEHNFTIHVYKIDPKKIYFWCNIPTAKEIYKDLRTESTDLEGLIQEMNSEKLSGYIDVSLDKGKESGLVFFDKGQIIGGSYSWDKGEMNGSKGSQELLIQKAKESSGIFRVSKISFPMDEVNSESKDIRKEPSPNSITMLGELLGIFERVIRSNKRIKANFNTLLKKKFVEKADEYAFLDPFVGEFVYADRKITFVGDASDEELARGVTESVKELAEEFRVLPQLRNECVFWARKYQRELGGIGFSL